MASNAIRISILADSKNAVDGLDKTGKAAEGLGSKFRSAAGAAAKYAAAGALLGAGAAVVGLAKLAQGAAEDQQAAALLAKTLKNTTGATDAQVKAVEGYISKVGVATGVTDDELRPALAKLATATGSVKKAQEATNLALDISAGSGANLESVTKGLAKAYTTGSVTALSKYGIAAKNADGSTKTLAQASEELGKKFGGAAATKADTLQGKIDRLKLILSEAGETIGYKVLPFITKFADYLVSKGIPAITKYGGEARDILVPILASIGDIITGKVIPAISSVIDFFKRYSDIIVPIAAGIGAIVIAFTAYQAVVGIVAAVTGAYTAVQAALNVVMTANPIGLLVLAIVGLVAGLIVAYKKSDEFRAVVDTAFGAIKNIVSTVLPVVLNVVTTVWSAIKTATQAAWGFISDKVIGPIGDAKAFVVTAVSGIKTGIVDTWETVKNKTSEVYNGIKTTITDKFGDVVKFIGDIPGKITALGGSFKDAGTGVMNQIIEGIKGAAGFIQDIGRTIYEAVRRPLNDAIDKINRALEFNVTIGGVSIGVNPPDIPHLAQGGVTNGRMLAVIGDNPGGREAVIPLNRSKALTDAFATALAQVPGNNNGGRTAPLIGTVTQAPGESADALAERLWFMTRSRA